MRVDEARHHHREPARRGGIGDVPDLVTDVAERAQQIHLALVGARQVAPVAHARHLRAAGFGLALLARNVREIAGPARIGDVHDRRAVVLGAAGERVRPEPAVMPDVGNPPAPLTVDDGLIGRPRLQAVVGDETHLAALGLVLGDDGAAQEQACDCDNHRSIVAGHWSPPVESSTTTSARHAHVAKAYRTLETSSPV